jgi:hypothetical protein
MKKMMKNLMHIWDFIPLAVSIGLLVVTIREPYGRETLPIPNLGGIFYRSLFVVSLLPVVWSFIYGLKKAILLTMAFYSFQEFVFTNVYFGEYGKTMLIVTNPFWVGRIALMGIWVFVILLNGWYSINWKSVYAGLFTLGWLDYLIATWPMSWLNGEGNIPLSPMPQIQEFISISSFVVWAFFLFTRLDERGYAINGTLKHRSVTVSYVVFAVSLNVILAVMASLVR